MDSGNEFCIQLFQKEKEKKRGGGLSQKKKEQWIQVPWDIHSSKVMQILYLVPFKGLFLQHSND